MYAYMLANRIESLVRISTRVWEKFKFSLGLMSIVFLKFPEKEKHVQFQFRLKYTDRIL